MVNSSGVRSGCAETVFNPEKVSERSEFFSGLKTVSTQTSPQTIRLKRNHFRAV